MYTYIHWYFDSAIITFKNFVNNFLNIIRWGNTSSLNILIIFVFIMLFATLKSFMSNLLVNIFLDDVDGFNQSIMDLS